MKRKFTCAHCGKKNSFAPNDVPERIVHIQERVGCPNELIAYLPSCAFCGQTTRVPAAMSRKSTSTSGKMTSANRRNAEAPLALPREDSGIGADFWRSRSVEDLAREQGVKPVENPNDLKGDFWPRDESVDEFLTWLQALRREGKENR